MTNKAIKGNDGLSVKKKFHKNPNIMTEKCYFYYAEVAGIPQTGFHGVDDEEIKTHLIEREKVYQLMDEMKVMDCTTLIALNWFRANKYHELC